MNRNYYLKIFGIVGIFLFISYGLDLKAQNIFGDWIKTKVSYLDNAIFLNENILKYQFIRYTFDKDTRFYSGTSFDDRGTAFSFEVNDSIILIKNSYGYITNSFLISKVTDNELILIQKGHSGFSDSDCIKFYFMREKTYQNSLRPKKSHVLTFSNGDTIYKSSEKLHARFNYPISFTEYCYENIPEYNLVRSSDNSFLYTFVVRKTGIIDSIHASGTTNKIFDKQFRKALDRSHDSWEPAELNGGKVDVQMDISFRFYSSDKLLEMLDYYQMGKALIMNLDYKKALYNFELAAEIKPEDYEILYFKAICELNLGKKNEACADLRKVDLTGRMNMDELLEINCK